MQYYYTGQAPLSSPLGMGSRGTLRAEPQDEAFLPHPDRCEGYPGQAGPRPFG